MKSLNPIFILFVDVINKKCFYIYLSETLILQLGINEENDRTIYFSKENEITSKNVCNFYNSAKEIYESCKRVGADGEANKLTVSEMIDKETMAKLQDEVDRFNGLMDNELIFIKNQLFPQVWKFGLAYSTTKNGVATGIYKIMRGENGAFIKDFNFESRESSIFISAVRNTDVEQNVNKCLSTLIERYFKGDNINLQYFPLEVLEEIVFAFLDELSRYIDCIQNPNYPTIYFKDEESLDTIVHYWNALLSMSIDYIQVFDDSTVKKDILYVNPFQYLYMSKKPGGIEYAKIKFIEILQNGLQPSKTDFVIIVRGSFLYRHFLTSLTELERRKVKRVRRVWKHMDYLNFSQDIEENIGFERIKTGYRTKDYSNNLVKLFTMLPYHYNELSKNVLGNYHEIIQLKKHYYLGLSLDGDFQCYYVAIDSKQFQITITEDELNDIKSYNKNYSGHRIIVQSSYDDIFRDKAPLYNYLKWLIYKSICKHLNISSRQLNNIIRPI